jgi:hypothetical protein
MMRRNTLWNTVVFAEKADKFDLHHPKFDNPILTFDNRRLRTKKQNVHTIADPFLFSNGDSLFLFVEEKRSFQHGKIKAFETKNLTDWTSHGVVLDPGFHCSYPHVFESPDGGIWMLPETIAGGELNLYRASEFPCVWEKTNPILKEKLCDNSIFFDEGKYFLFAGSDEGKQLDIYFSDSLNGAWQAHPKNPVVLGKKYARNGGGPSMWKGKRVRFAQDCVEKYGDRLHVMQIVKLSETEYEERVLLEDFLPRNQPWNRVGGHHFSYTTFGNNVVYARDGKSYDYLINKPIGALFRLIK